MILEYVARAEHLPEFHSSYNTFYRSDLYQPMYGSQGVEAERCQIARRAVQAPLSAGCRLGALRSGCLQRVPACGSDRQLRGNEIRAAGCLVRVVLGLTRMSVVLPVNLSGSYAVGRPAQRGTVGDPERNLTHPESDARKQSSVG